MIEKCVCSRSKFRWLSSVNVMNLLKKNNLYIYYILLTSMGLNKLFTLKYWSINIVGVLLGYIIMFIFEFQCNCGWPGMCQCQKHWLYYAGLIILILSILHLLISIAKKIGAKK